MKTTKNVGLIGYGHLGKALTEHIQTKTGTQVHVSEGRGHNTKIAENADILILTVKPEQIAEVIEEIREALKEETVIVSFASSASKVHIRQGISNDVVRAMTDIEFKQIIAEQHTGVRALLDALSENELMETDEEEQIDIFTVLVGCLPGVAAWQFLHNEDAGEWLEKYITFIERTIGVPHTAARQICEKVWRDHESGKVSLETKVFKVSTKGGITEALISALETKNDVSFTELLSKGMDRISTIQRGLIK